MKKVLEVAAELAEKAQESADTGIAKYRAAIIAKLVSGYSMKQDKAEAVTKANKTMIIRAFKEGIESDRAADDIARRALKKASESAAETAAKKPAAKKDTEAKSGVSGASFVSAAKKFVKYNTNFKDAIANALTSNMKLLGIKNKHELSLSIGRDSVTVTVRLLKATMASRNALVEQLVKIGIPAEKSNQNNQFTIKIVSE